jgi:hypothetical protein
MTLRQEQERRLRSFGVFSRRASPQPLEALPVDRLFGLLILLPTLGFCVIQQPHVLLDYGDSCPGRLDAAVNHLPALAPGFAAFRLRPAHRLLPTVMTI